MDTMPAREERFDSDEGREGASGGGGRRVIVIWAMNM